METTLTWMGQSGFVLRSSSAVVACDLYLSDYCKRRSKLDHTRLMPIPVQPEKLTGIDQYLITHAHIDHFDPETVGPVMAASPAAMFYCPPFGTTVIDEFFPGYAERFTILASLTETELAPGVRLVAIPAAHEELETDADGEYVAFSYLLLLDEDKKAVFFAGDTIPFAEQGGWIRDHVPDGYALVMVLPVNGRDAERAALGFKGNLTLNEAVALYKECNGDCFVPCHFGMFALNDIKEPLAETYFSDNNICVTIPEPNVPFAI